MSRTNVEWCVNPDGSRGFGLNPFGWGCTHDCSYCYANTDAKRFGDFICNQYPTEEQVARYGLDPKHTLCWNFFPHLHEERIEQPLKRKKPTTVFLGSMSDLWDSHVPMAWRQRMWDVVQITPRHTYIILTKQPQLITAFEAKLLPSWPNVWVGVTLNRQEDIWRVEQLDRLICRHTLVSCEPLLGPVTLPITRWPSWLIIGAQTGAGANQPEASWVQTLLDDADFVNVPVFVKDNLKRSEPKCRELPYLETR